MPVRGFLRRFHDVRLLSINRVAAMLIMVSDVLNQITGALFAQTAVATEPCEGSVLQSTSAPGRT